MQIKSGVVIPEGTTDYLQYYGLTMRHTPPLRGTPLLEGMGSRIVLNINKSLPRHPLLERGEGTANGRSDSEVVNKNEGRGVLHRQTNAIRCFSVAPSGLFFGEENGGFSPKNIITNRLSKNCPCFCPVL